MSGRRFSMRANTKVLFPRLLPSKGIHISVNIPRLGDDRVPIAKFNSNVIIGQGLAGSLRACHVAYMSVKGPRYIVFASSVSQVSLRRVNSQLRTSTRFPQGAGIRFTRLLGGGLLHVHM